MAPVTLESQVFWAPPAATCAALGKQMKWTQVQRPESSSQQYLLAMTSPTTDVSSDGKSRSNYTPLTHTQVLAEPTKFSSVTIPTPQDLDNKESSAPARSSSTHSPPKEEVPRGLICGALPPSYSQPADIAAAQRNMVHEMNGMSETGRQSLGSVANQNCEPEGNGDYCANDESRYPIDPLLEPQSLLPPQMVHGDIAMHNDCETAGRNQQCQIRSTSGVDTGHSRQDGIDDDNEESQKRGQREPAPITTRRGGGSTAAFPATETIVPERQMIPRRLPSPTTSHGTTDAEDVGAIGAGFKEWPLPNAALKRVIVDGVATFQLQFEWPLPVGHGRRGAASRTVLRASKRGRGSQPKRRPPRGPKFTPAEDDLLLKLKGKGNLSWAQIHQQFKATFRDRPIGSLQVHYSTVLKGR